MDIANLKKVLDKSPKSLLFARLSDELRLANSEEQKNEALDVVNKGLEINSNFLPGKLARGRILFEKGDFTGARIDFEAVAEQDPFCLSAQKLLLETLTVLEQPPKTEIYTRILNTLEPKVKIETNAQEIRKAVPAVAPVAATPVLDQSVSDALDSILEEDDNDNETEILNLLLQTFENIFGKILSKKPTKPTVAPNIDNLVKEQLVPKMENLPDLTSDINSLLTTVPVSLSSVAPNIDNLVEEQLAPKVENLPDLTGELDSLLQETDNEPVDSVSSADNPPVSDSPAEKVAPSVDDLVAEQLAPKVENLPDLTSDMDSLLAEGLPPDDSVPSASDSPAEKVAPSIDDLVAEQLAPKVENLPDLTNDMDSLLAKGLPPDDSVPSASDSPAEKVAPSIDDLVAEQLAPKVENLPDLTNDMDSLLAEGLPPDDSVPSASDSPAEKVAPSIDDLVAEQLAPKVENLPDLTNDMDSLLAEGLPPDDSVPSAFDSPASDSPVEKPAPSIDDLVKEQLVSKVGNLPDLTSDMDSLLAEGLPPDDSAPPASDSPVGKPAPSIDDLIKEQLAPKVKNLPDLTNDMDSLLQEEDNEILTQNPTPTLAELYISQGLPQKAVAVYKELLARDPGNAELQAKLAIAQAQV